MKNLTDDTRFYDVVWPLMATVLRAATYLTECSADADDLAQETMLKAFKALDRLQPGSNVKAWLLAILRNAHVDGFRARGQKETSLEQLEYEPAEPTPWEPRQDIDIWRNPESVLNELSDQTIIDALRRLPKEIRWTLLLSDIEGLEEADAAAILAVPVGTIKSRLHRGRKILRQLLTPLARARRMAIPTDRPVAPACSLPFSDSPPINHWHERENHRKTE